jgi:hypothetical protein
VFTYSSRWIGEAAGGLAAEALRRGDVGGALVAQRAASEAALLEAWTWELLQLPTAVATRSAPRGWLGFGRPRLSVGDDEVERLEAFAMNRPETFVRAEAMEALGQVRHAGSFSQRRRARRVLARLVDDADPAVGELAGRLLSQPWRREGRDWDVTLSRAWEALGGD